MYFFVIDRYSKYLWARPVKRKNAGEVSKAMLDILKIHKRRPVNLQTDQGKEFYNKQFKTLMETNSINHYSTYWPRKGAIVEQFIRTVEGWTYNTFSMRGKYMWLDILQDTTRLYNNRVNRTIGMKSKLN